MNKNNFKFNLFKFISSVLIPWVPSESLKMGSAMQIYNFTNSYWLVTTLFMLMQLPLVVVQIFNKQLLKIMDFKKGLIFLDFVSAVFLVVPIIMWNLFPISTNTELIVAILLILNVLQSFTYSLKTLYIKKMTHFISSSNKEFNVINNIFNLGVGLSLLISPIFSVEVFNKVTFDIFMTINLIFYLISMLLFRLVKLNKSPFEKEVKKVETDKIVHNNIYLITFISISTLFLFTRQSGVISFFNYYQYDFHFWSYYLAITMAFVGILGLLVAFIVKKKKININNTILLFMFFALNISWLFISQIKNTILSITWFFIINAIQQFIINFANNNISFETKNISDKNICLNIKKLVLIVPVISSIFFTYILTYVLVNVSYYHSYILYTLILLTMLLLLYSYRKKELINSKDI
ncbi:MFS transporter [Mycoplasma sp. CSL7503-lung]|uniref:MFS transporter n=1 Tax=Mycoplasma sp. CSL7503-lung TaxID=536372 RepID=UPI0021CF6210|nr:MFS transporter [Mycoplasma sp. CSL7503-lung]MCU4706590.1 MFS transporter [Mycoplasma sp. CSL7503-lung]